jgi:alpha-tubulin suppressor-like RCC1 family protein
LESGGVRCWGGNDERQLGDSHLQTVATGPELFWTSPAVEDIVTNIANISAGERHTCAVTKGAELRCWGQNVLGQLGDLSGPSGMGSLTNTVLANVAAVSTGRDHTCALMKSGGVRCWGDNDSGQLGTGDDVAVLSPPAQDILENAVQVEAAGDYTCALRADHTVWCWGARVLAGGTRGEQYLPADVGVANARAIASGAHHACAVLETGSVRCWGVNSKGQLGEPAPLQYRAEPGPEFLSNIQSISAGADYSCALSKSGDVYCWGANQAGQLGNGFKSDWELPSGNPVLSGALAIEAGTTHVCALLNDGTVQCWGDNGWGQLGDGTRLARLRPVSPRSFCAPTAGIGTTEPVRTCASGTPLTVKQLAAGYVFNCALLSSGAVRCWGDNVNGQLGDGTTTARSLPGRDLLQGVKSLTAGASHVCALMDSGGVRCWGDNSQGQLGDGTTVHRLLPPANDVLTNVQAVSAHMFHTCALTGGKVTCWGSNEGGALGDGVSTNGFRTSPSPPLAGVENATDVAAGELGTCVLTQGKPVCWGQPWNDDAPTPIAVNATIRSLALGYMDGCFVTSSNLVECNKEISVDQLSDVQQLTVAGPHCALLTSGVVHCWGPNNQGALGDSTHNTRFDLGPPILLNAAAIESDYDHTCAILTNGQLQCWGLNSHGQLGDGTTINRPYPVPGPTFCP